MNDNSVWVKGFWPRYLLGYPVTGKWKTDATWTQRGRMPTGRRDPVIPGPFGPAYLPGYQRFALRHAAHLLAGQLALDAVDDHVTIPSDVLRYVPDGFERWTADVVTGLTTGAFGLDASDGALTVVGLASVAGLTGVALRRAGIATDVELRRVALDAFGRVVNLEPLHPDVRRTERAVRQNIADAVKLDRAPVRAHLDGRKVSSVSVTLPPTFRLTEATGKALSDAVRRVVGLDWETSFPDLTTSRDVEFTRPPEIKTIVPYADVRDFMLSQPAGSLVLGIDASGELLVHSLDSDEPHIALSMGTGRGKSTFYLSVIAQLLEQGADVDIADVKQISLEELRDVDGVTIHREIHAIWDALKSFRMELGERMEVVKQLPLDEWDSYLNSLRRRVFVFEEMNAFRSLSQTYWDRVRQPGQRATPEIYGVLSEILMMGRALRMHVFVAGQRLSAKAIGDGDNREQFGLRLLSNPSRQTWNLLADGTMPARSKVRGRAVAVRAGENTIFQGVYMKLPDVLAHVTVRRDPSTYVLPSYVSITRENTEDMGHGTRVLVTLGEYARESGQSVDALRKASQRPGFPASVATGERGARLYDREDLRSRERGAQRADGASLYDASAPVIDDTDDVSV